MLALPPPPEIGSVFALFFCMKNIGPPKFGPRSLFYWGGLAYPPPRNLKNLCL